MPAANTPYPHQLVALGGTFDHFHRGHREFVKFAAQLAPELIIGVTAPPLTSGKQWAQTIELLETRLASVTAFCQAEQIKASFPILNDIYGPTLTAPIDGLCATPETEAGALVINRRRQAMGLTKVPIHTFPIVLDETGQPLHSDRVRAGLIDREGRSYQKLFTAKRVLSTAQRDFFATPQGPLIDLTRPPVPGPAITMVVGDSSLETFIANHWPYDVGIFDHQRQRQPSTSNIIAALTQTDPVHNPAGSIMPELAQAILQSCESGTKEPTPRTIRVIGEEDLAAVAGVMLLPLESQIFYGQPNQGIVMMKVTEELKLTVRKVLEQG